MSPSTGVIDSHSLMLAYQGDAEDHGAMIAFISPIIGGQIAGNGIEIRVADDQGNETRLACDLLVNSAGLHAQNVARSIDGIPPDSVPAQYFCKGSYFSLLGRQPFGRLIYPVPASASLGVHVTVDLAGQVRFGPDQEWIDDIDYDVDPTRADTFYEAVRRYYPDLADGALQPAYSGVRPKLQAPGEPAADFVVQGPEVHGVDGLVNLYGIESPGLTSSLAIAELVGHKLGID